MKRWRTKGIVLRRVDFGEADRIITFLTPEGKVGVMAKGVRKPKSKLAGGIELFSESDITLIEGKGKLDTLISARLISHYGNVISDYERVELGYQTIQAINKNTQDDTDASHYDLLKSAFIELDDKETPIPLIRSWFYLNLLDELGHRPNLTHSASGSKLKEGKKYAFNPSEATFTEDDKANITSEHIKAWRLLLANNPSKLRKIRNYSKTLEQSSNYISQLFEFHTNS